MPHLIIATAATAVPMGAQVYEQEVASRAGETLAGWTVERSVARSLRSPLAGDLRLPMGWLQSAPSRSRRALGRLVYPRDALVHRMDLLLPPAPGFDVVTLHDTIAWQFTDESAPVRAAAGELRRAAAVVCVSQYSAQQAVDLLGIRDPHVVHNGVDARFLGARQLTTQERDILGLPGPYVLHAGGASARKNLEGLAAAWPLVHGVRGDLVLALCGPPHERRDRLFSMLAGTRLLGRQPDDLLPPLMASAEAVVVPSTHEGFGLPALEAMAAGTPVVAANRSALPEVVGDSGILVEPDGPQIAEGLLWAVSGDAEVVRLVDRARNRAGLFTWERCAQGHARVWRAVASGVADSIT